MFLGGKHSKYWNNVFQYFQHFRISCPQTHNQYGMYGMYVYEGVDKSMNFGSPSGQPKLENNWEGPSGFILQGGGTRGGDRGGGSGTT